MLMFRPMPSHLHNNSSSGGGYTRRRRNNLGRWILIGAIAVVALLAQQAQGAGDAVGDYTAGMIRSPSANHFKRFLGQCTSYCSAGVGPVDLWLSLEEVCYSAPDAFSRQQQLAGGNAATTANRNSNSLGKTGSVNYSTSGLTGTSGWRWWWSSVYPVALCSLVTTAGLFVGFRFGSRLASVPKAAWHPLL